LSVRYRTPKQHNGKVRIHPDCHPFIAL